MSKVPFALHSESNEYVGVHDVPRGAECGCICPSCKTPLNARQGRINAWHFAHATRGTSDKTDKDCEYSFFVSVTQMAKQLFAESPCVELTLPAYSYHLVEQHPISGRELTKKVAITRSSKVVLSTIQVEGKFESHPADVLGYVNGFPLIIGFSHTDKDFFTCFEELGNQRVGVIEIDLEATWHLFFEQRSQPDRSFTEQLKNYLLQEEKHKKWLYHPRQLQVLPAEREALLKELAEDPLRNRQDRIDEMITRALDGFILNKGR